jgi:hypothetical protein
MMKVRALLVWMSAQPIFSQKWLSGAPFDSPEGVFCRIQRREMSYATLFATLCRYALFLIDLIMFVTCNLVGSLDFTKVLYRIKQHCLRHTF